MTAANPLDYAARLLDIFRPRMDVYAKRFDNASQTAAMNRFLASRTLPGEVPREYQVGDWKPVGPKGARTRLTVEEVFQHIGGSYTLGVYPLHPDGTCHTASVDLDNHRGAQTVEGDPEADYQALVRVCERLGVPYLGNRSRGGHGYWLHLVLSEATPAREARAVLHGILDLAKVRHITDGGSFDMVCPKQDRPTPSMSGDPTANPGSLLCLPINAHWLAADPSGTGLVGHPTDLLAQVNALAGVQRIEEKLWTALREQFVKEDVRPTGFPLTGAMPAHVVMPPIDVSDSMWHIALRRAGRLGRALGDGKTAVLCINDEEHSRPDGTADRANGSCVLFPPRDAGFRGVPYCSHAHCDDLTFADWVDGVGGVLVLEDVCRELRERGVRHVVGPLQRLVPPRRFVGNDRKPRLRAIALRLTAEGWYPSMVEDALCWLGERTCIPAVSPREVAQLLLELRPKRAAGSLELATGVAR